MAAIATIAFFRSASSGVRLSCVRTPAPLVMEYTNYFAVDVAPWGDFGIDTVPKSKKCKVKGWTQLAKSVDVDFLPALMEPAPVTSPNKANKYN